MKLSCLFGHKWEGCKCQRCGKLRDEEHKWNYCKCLKCGKVRDEEHNFTYRKKDENTCVATCRKCKKIVEQPHDWNSCECKKCGATCHDYQPIPDSCKKKCTKCGDIKMNKHEYIAVEGKCKKVCKYCGAEYWEPEHTWAPVSGKCEEKCKVCGETRTIPHQYLGGKCTRCGMEDPNAFIKSCKYKDGVWANSKNMSIKYHSFTNEQQAKLIQQMNLMDMADFLTRTAANKDIVWLSSQMVHKLLGEAEMGHHTLVCDALKTIGMSNAISVYMNASIAAKESVLTSIMLKYANKERNLFADHTV